VVVTLGTALGGSVAVFSLLNATVLRTLDVPEPHRLAAISVTDPRTGQPAGIYTATFEAFRARQSAFSVVSMYNAGLFRVTARGTSVDVSGEGVSHGYFEMLGLTVAAGRPLLPGDGAAASGGPPGVVISHALWRRLLGADPNALGETIEVDARPVTVVGVAPPGARGLEPENGVDLYLPVEVARANPAAPTAPLRVRYAVGRLAAGVTIAQARAEVLARWPALIEESSAVLPSPEREAAKALVVSVDSAARGFSTLRNQYGATYAALLGLAATLLLVAIVNVGHLVASAQLSRRHEFAVRLALGAGRGHLAGNLILDGIVLALLGLTVALPLAWWAVEFLTATQTAARAIPLARPLTPDARVLWMAAGTALLIGLSIGLLSARIAIAGPPNVALLRGRGASRPTGRGARAVLVAQIGLSMVLVVGAGLFVLSLGGLRANVGDFGGRPILWTRLSVNPGDRTTFDRAYYQSLSERLSAIPGAGTAVFSSLFPAYLGYVGALPLTRFSATAVAGGEPEVRALVEVVSPRFFRAFGVAHLRGRDFTWDDDAGAGAVAVLSRSAAEALFKAGDPVGGRVRADEPRLDLEVVGVVDDAPIGNLREPHVPVVYRPMLQDLPRARFPLAHVPVSGDPAAARRAYVEAVESQRHHFVRGLFTLDEWTRFALLQERLLAGVSSSAAALAGVLACVGIFGVLARTVAARAREIGVRLALGASKRQIARLVIGDALRVVGLGIILGVAGALAVARLTQSLLYGVGPTDARVVVIAALSFVGIGIIAATVPALRAARVDPAVALRQE
jgi:predicted permease